MVYLRQDDRSQRARTGDRPYLVGGWDAARNHADASHDLPPTVDQLDLAAQILRDLGASNISLPDGDVQARAVLTEHGLTISAGQRLHDATGS